jgi:NADH dehydrogenase FAD-containing subunit
MGHHVVLLGGSYGGIAEMRRLSKYPEIQVTPIDRYP